MENTTKPFIDAGHFRGTYGAHRDKAAVEAALSQVSKILDDLARTQGVSCVVVASDLFVKGPSGHYEPVVAQGEDEVALGYYRDILGPIIDFRKCLCADWATRCDNRMGFHLSA